jgi:hypothetical protein
MRAWIAQDRRAKRLHTYGGRKCPECDESGYCEWCLGARILWRRRDAEAERDEMQELEDEQP